MSASEVGSWHGWMSGDSALFITPTSDGEHIGLYMQQGRSTELAAVFVDPAMGQLVMDWMDASLAATAAANTELMRRLASEQPLFAQQPRPQLDPDLVEEDDER